MLKINETITNINTGFVKGKVCTLMYIVCEYGPIPLGKVVVCDKCFSRDVVKMPVLFLITDTGTYLFYGCLVNFSKHCSFSFGQYTFRLHVQNAE